MDINQLIESDLIDKNQNNKVLDKNVKSFDNYLELDLRNLEITSLNGIEKFSKITRLDISYNDIKILNGLMNLNSLEVLHAFNNKISLVDLDLKSLKILTLSNNKITSLPKIHFNCINLKELYINNNEISDISTLDHLTNLRRFNFNDNQITNISAMRDIIRNCFSKGHNNPCNDRLIELKGMFK